MGIDVDRVIQIAEAMKIARAREVSSKPKAVARCERSAKACLGMPRRGGAGASRLISEAF